MKCPACGITVPDMPEDAAYEETLCNTCYQEYEEDELIVNEDDEDELFARELLAEAMGISMEEINELADEADLYKKTVFQ